MMSKPATGARLAWFSPWLIIGSVSILAVILLALAVKNHHRERTFMTRTLLSEADTLMRSLEAGSRTGMMGMGWGRRQLQVLMEETARQPDVAYVALVASNGRIVAHSDPERIGETISLPASQPGETVHRFVEGTEKSFEVIRRYQPWSTQQGRHRGRGAQRECPNPAAAEMDRDLSIIVGLDPEPLEEALNQDLRQTGVLFAVMLLIGAAGFTSLFWAQSYRAAGRSLRDIQAFTSTVVNQMPIGLIAADSRGRIQRVNETALSIFGKLAGLGAGIDGISCFTAVTDLLKTRERVSGYEVQYRTDDDRPLPLTVNASIIRDGERKPAGVVILFSDVSEIKQLEERLRRSERLASLGRLAAGVAHEIRNPLSSIKGFAAILAGRFKEGDRDRKIAEVMEREVERLNRVVSELLDFSRPTEIRKKPVMCLDLIRDSLKLVERDARERGISVEYRAEPESLEVMVDPDRFSQALLNLYLNAVQAMEDGGKLSVEAYRKEDRVTLSVADTGVGIAPEQLPHIFDPYFTTKPSGVGLGLANVHKLVEAHGGGVEARSLPEGGTVFLINLPVD